jgi:hypothetical protein
MGEGDAVVRAVAEPERDGGGEEGAAAEGVSLHTYYLDVWWSGRVRSQRLAGRGMAWAVDGAAPVVAGLVDEPDVVVVRHEAKACARCGSRTRSR